MNRNGLIPLLLLFALLFSGCTTEVIRPGADYKKAAEANARLGLGYMRQGNFELAMIKLKKALSFDEENISALHYMAELHRRLGETTKADMYYLKAIDLSPDDIDIQNNYGVFLCERGQYDAADQRFEKVLENPLYTTRSKVYENIGLCAKRRGDLKKAEASFHKALLMDPRLSKSLLEMAMLSYDRGQHDLAYGYYQRYIKLAEQTPQSLWMGVLLEQKQGDNSKAASYALLLKRKFPQTKEARLARQMLEKRKNRR